MRGLVRAVTTVEQRIFLSNLLRSAKNRIRRMPMVGGGKVQLAKGQPLRLHLGCGNIGIPGYCNVDVMGTIGADVIDDIRKLRRFQNNTASEIYACHVLEHFGHDEVLPILSRWFEVLEPGGVIRISVPDIDRIVKIYSANPAHFNTPGHSPWIGLIYGGQSTPYDYHKTGFNFCWLKHLMEQCGFEDFSEYPHEPHFVPGVVDASMAKEPFGQHFSLNLMAHKPG